MHARKPTTLGYHNNIIIMRYFMQAHETHTHCAFNLYGERTLFMYIWSRLNCACVCLCVWQERRHQSRNMPTIVRAPVLGRCWEFITQNQQGLTAVAAALVILQGGPLCNLMQLGVVCAIVSHGLRVAGLVRANYEWHKAFPTNTPHNY